MTADTAITRAEARRRMLGALILGRRIVVADLPPGWAAVADGLVADGCAQQRDGVLTLVPPDGAGTIVPAARLILTALEADGAVNNATWTGRAAAAGIALADAASAYRWLTAAGLIVDSDEGVTRPAGGPRVPAKPATVPAPVAKPRPAPKPKPAPPRVATPRPALDPAAELLELQRRATFAAEVSAGLVAAPQRVRTPLGVSPLLDCQLRVAVLLHAASQPMSHTEIKEGYLSKSQIPFLAAALRDGTQRGGFAVAEGRFGMRGCRYAVADPGVFDFTWESLGAAADAVRARRAEKGLAS